MAMRVINDYEHISVDWFLGDEGHLEDYDQDTLPTEKEFQPQRARVFLAYLQLGMTERQALLEVPVDEGYIRSWKRGKYGAPNTFIEAYELAQKEQITKLANEIIDIADGTDRLTEQYIQDRMNEIKNPFKPDEEVDLPAAIKAALKDARDRSGMRIDVRKWMASKAMPSKFGDKLSLEHTGDVKNPVSVNMKNLTTEQLEKIAALNEELNGGKA